MKEMLKLGGDFYIAEGKITLVEENFAHVMSLL
jgi:hypothetical protein